MRPEIKDVFQRSVITLSLFLLSAAPAHAGVINIEFTAEVTNLTGSLGGRPNVIAGLITIDLIDIADQNPSASGADFDDGQFAGTDLGLTRAITVDLVNTSFPASADRIEGAGSVSLSVTNSANGDGLEIVLQSFRTGDPFISDLFFGFGGNSDLFAGDEPLNGNLPTIEELLLSIDTNQLTPDENGFIGGFQFSAGSSRIDTTTYAGVTSVSITSATQQVPEPGPLGTLALCLFLLRCRAAYKARNGDFRKEAAAYY